MSTGNRPLVGETTILIPNALSIASSAKGEKIRVRTLIGGKLTLTAGGKRVIRTRQEML